MPWETAVLTIAAAARRFEAEKCILTVEVGIGRIRRIELGLWGMKV